MALDSGERFNFDKNAISPRQLIHQVKIRPILWQRNSGGNRNLSAREEAWQEVYNALVPSYNNMNQHMKSMAAMKIVKMWYNLRDTYKKSLRNRRSKTYTHSSQLSFLNSIYLKTSRAEESADEENVSTMEASKEEIEDCEENNEEEYLEPDFELINFYQATTNEDTMPIDDTVMKDDFNASTVSVLSNLIAREQDEDRAFFNSVLPMVKTLSEHQKIDFRIQMMQLLRNYKEE